MNDWLKRLLGPEKMKDLEDPAFLEHVRQQFPGPVRPDDEDYDMTARPQTTEEEADQYWVAQARKLMRMYREWKAGKN
jgi:hypothetical protein